MNKKKLNKTPKMQGKKERSVSVQNRVREEYTCLTANIY